MLVKQMVIRVKIHFIWRLTSIFRGRAHPCLHLLHNCFYPVSRGPCSQGKLSREVMSHSLRHAKLFCLLSLELQIKFDKIGQCFSFSFLFLAIFALCKSFHFALFCSVTIVGNEHGVLYLAITILSRKDRRYSANRVRVLNHNLFIN